jgi:DNA-binding CsgD family transcriptional regulator
MSDNILSKREQQVFELIVSGMSRREVARVLGIAIRTVEVHINRIRYRALRDGKIRIRK